MMKKETAPMSSPIADRLRQREAELALLNSVSDALTRQLDFQGIIDAVGEKIHEIFGTDIVMISLYDEQAGIARFPYWRFGGEQHHEPPRPLRNAPIASYLIASRQPLRFGTLAQATAWHADHGGLHPLHDARLPESWLTVPIIVADRVIGSVGLQQFTAQHFFDENAARLLSTLAASMGTALENARLFREAQAARAAAEAADRTKSDFLSNVSHELRTPLTSMLGFTRIIQKQLETRLFPRLPADEQAVTRAVDGIRQDLSIILAEGERLTSLINNVLDLAKIEAGKIEWNMQLIDLNQIVTHAAAATAALFEQKPIRLVTETDPSAPHVLGDKDRLIQVVINLISNAVKFTEQGTVTCRVEQYDGNVIVRVIDTGIGIAPDDLPAVFEKFRQVGDSLTSKPNGTGLGLPICKEIVEAHGGQLWAESELGMGSMFAFALPGAITDTPLPVPISLDAISAQVEAAVDAQRRAGGAAGARAVLLTGDDPPVRERLYDVLTGAAYTIDEAADAAGLWAHVQAAPPALIIAQSRLIDGDVVAWLRARGYTRGSGLVLYT